MRSLQAITALVSRIRQAFFRPDLAAPERDVSARPDFLTIITRFKNEPFAAEFVEYYLSQGADRIFILDDHSSLSYGESVLREPRVTILPAHSFAENEMRAADQLYQRIRSQSEWFAVVDADEFITTKRNPHWTIRDELAYNFRDVDCIKVPWVMMSGNGRERDPASLLGEIIHRWDHDRRHPHPYRWHKGRCRYKQIEVKCIFRGVAFGGLHHSHYPAGPCRGVRTVDGIRIRPAGLDAFHPRLREADISSGHLLCYHYRIISRQSCLRKIADTNFPAYRTAVENLLASLYMCHCEAVRPRQSPGVAIPYRTAQH